MKKGQKDMEDKSFKATTDLFFGLGATPEEEPSPAPDPIVPEAIPAGYTLKKEAKTDRLQILLRPTTHKALKKLAKKTRKSKNELISEAIEKLLSDYAENGKA